MNTATLSIAHILWALGIGSAYAFWPIIGRYSGAPGTWINTVVIIGSAIGGIGLAYPSMRELPAPDMRAILLLLFAGLVNGAAVYFQCVRVADTQTPTSAFIATVIATMVVMTLLFNLTLNGAAPSIRQMFGASAIVLGIIILAS